MSKISILDLATLNQADSFLTELSETELQISGGGHCRGYGGKNGGRGNGGSSSGGGKYGGGSGSGSGSDSGRKGRGGKKCHPCW